jgi:hypothetical protein
METCELRATNGHDGVPCDESSCIFWRVAGHLDLVERADGCAIQYFELLGEHGSEVAVWLLSVKRRLESECEGSA